LREGGVDIILLDLTLPEKFVDTTRRSSRNTPTSTPDSGGLDTFQTIRARAGGTPIVVLSGIDDEELAVRAVREGAQDYLLKGDLTASTLVRALAFAIERHKVHAAAPEPEQP
jgi:DNA-binding NarL/FixJ family response regulator